ncbi:MAG TPA: hypothetical protein DCS28_04270 [Candidatus Moranbacteria bacterium]|nr:hypothetical protein [Candidatus Moranbacteria bacterium]HAT75225.1 hypothetical protein [Candidatus Moranbacteria bacterium]
MSTFFADECINRDIILALRKNGFDILTVYEANLIGASDNTIFDFACREKRILLTFDRGFGDIFRFNISACFGIIVVLAGQFTADEIIGAFLNFIAVIEKNSGLKNRLAIIGKNKIRIISQ